MPKSPSFGRLLALLLAIAAAGPSASSTRQESPGALKKIDKSLRARALNPQGRSRVIVRGVDGASSTEVADAIRGAGGASGKALKLIHGRVADLPNRALTALASHPRIAQLSEDRGIVGAMERTGASVGATAVRQDLGYDGSGIGVAVIDSGVAAHDDLAGANGAPRVDRFVDFVNGQDDAYDDYGHGTHVAGIIAGNGTDSGGARSGIAPGARLVVLKVLDSYGSGYISDVIDALDYVVTNKDELNIRVVNLSIATGVYESFETDPLTVAAEQVVKQGVVVVAAAGNSGRGRTDSYGTAASPLQVMLPPC
jgi:serine protease AprX